MKRLARCHNNHYYTHSTIQEQFDSKTADWMEKVSDKLYHDIRQDNKPFG
jgi:hypothetical protein